MLHAVDFHAAARSDVGLVRANNQDSGYAGTNLLLLADGMGGPAGGDIASSVAVAHFVPLDSDSHSSDSLLPLLHEALQNAHNELCERSAHDRDLEGLGTTCIALMRSGNKLAMVHIGDSRAYLLRGDTLTQVTTDHSFVQYLVDSGQITPEEAESHPQRNVVMRILGDSAGDVTPDENIREAVLGDRWLLCSDGLSGVVSAATISEVLQTVEDPNECAEELIRLALLAGGPDNVTCVVADIVPAGSIPPQPPQIVGAAAVDRSAPTRGGSGAAAKAAALRTPAPIPVEDDEPIVIPQPSTPWWIPALTFIITVLIAGGTWLAWAWTQTQYYVQIEGDTVVVHQGIPQKLGPWELSHPVEVADIEVADLAPVDRERLEEPILRSSRDQIDEYIAQLQSSILDRKAKDAVKNLRSDSPQSGTNDAQSGAQPSGGGA